MPRIVHGEWPDIFKVCMHVNVNVNVNNLLAISIKDFDNSG